ncbi:MAG: methyl-accepting chemotaxis protein [Pseudomonadales bacterium]|nr:methyl-accepting chemotaxis protein [Pseudomonadales bacterium]
MDILRAFKISRRIQFLILLAFLSIIAITATNLNQLRDELLAQKSIQTRNLVETAHSLIKAQYDQFQAGVITEDQAKQQAIKIVKSMRYEDNNYFWINDYAPRVIMHPIKPQLDGKNVSNVKDASGKLLFVEIVKVARSHPDGGILPYLWPKPNHDEPVEKVSYVKAFQPWEWVVGSGIYIDDVDVIFFSQAKIALGMSLFLVLLLLCVSYIIARSILLPLNSTSSALLNLSQGEGDLTQTLSAAGNDEVTVLVRAFNNFVDKIKHTVIQVEEVGKSVNMSSLELSEITDINKQQLESQHMEITQVSTAVNQMSATVQDIASSAENAAAAARQADAEAQEGMIVMQSTTESIELLASNVDSAVSVINQLETESQRIGSVIEVIQSIAAQTNLLALNAAIEAARAGEQGRGFAVVADEVRTLASRTQQATEEINKMIEELQNQSEKAVQVMAESNENTKSTIEKVGNAALSLRTIVSSVNEISDMNIQIASAAEQQSAAANEIDQSIVRIASLADESFKSGNKVAESSVNLAALGDQLNTLISTFKTR